jgi:hypothetical protein
MSRRRIYVTVTGLDKPVIAEDGCTTFEMRAEPVSQDALESIHTFGQATKLTPAETETVTNLLMDFLNKRDFLKLLTVGHARPGRKTL